MTVSMNPVPALHPEEEADTQATALVADWRSYEPVHYSRILDASLQAFYEHGYHGTTTRDLARRTGLSVPGLYHHYPSKQDILFTLMNVIIDELLARSRLAVETAAPAPDAQFDALVEALLRFHMYRRQSAIVSTSELRSLEPENRKRYVAKRDAQQRMLDRVVEDGVAAGLFTTPFTADASRAIASLCVGVATWYRPDGGLSVEELLDRYLAIARSIVGASDAPAADPSVRPKVSKTTPARQAKPQPRARR